MREGITSYVLNEFLSFERKVYQVGDIDMPRVISLKAMSYFVGISFLLLVLLQLPLIGHLMRVIPWVFNFNIYMFWAAAAGYFTYLLTEVGTENRSPISAFQSMCRYYWLRMKQESYYAGKILSVKKSYTFDISPPVNQVKREQHQKAEKPLLVYKPVQVNERGQSYEFAKTISHKTN